jgi:4'-phosphopantetheinyl transferase
LEHFSLIKISVDWLLGTMLGEASHLQKYYDQRQIQDNMAGIEMAPLGQDDVEVRIASLDCRQSELRRFESILGDDEINRANRFHFQKDRERFVAGRGLLRVILSSYVAVPPSEIFFTYGSHGKPGIRRQNGRPAVEFNLAHSGGTAIYAITRDRPVGIDIESVKHEFPIESVAERFFSELEVAALRSLPKHIQRIAFFKCWTRKEAFIKAIGDGLSCPLSDFDVSLTPGEPARLLHVRWASEEAHRWCMEDIDSVAGCAAAIVFSGPQCRMHVSQWDLNSGNLTNRYQTHRGID